MIEPKLKTITLLSTVEQSIAALEEESKKMERVKDTLSEAHELLAWCPSIDEDTTTGELRFPHGGDPDVAQGNLELAITVLENRIVENEHRVERLKEFIENARAGEDYRLDIVAPLLVRSILPKKLEDELLEAGVI